MEARLSQISGFSTGQPICIACHIEHRLDNNCPTWVRTVLCGSISLPAFIISVMPFPSTISNINPVISHSLIIYSQFRKHFNLREMCLFSPVASNHLFLPSMQDRTFNMWHERGLKCFNNLFIHSKPASFEQLLKEFNIPQLQFLSIPTD